MREGAPKLSEQFAVHAVPTLLLMDHGKVISRQAGAALAPAMQVGGGSGRGAENLASEDARRFSGQR